MGDELSALDATGQAALLRAGDVSAAELVDAAIERIERVDPEVNAVIIRRFDAARREAAAGPNGPFAGVPMLVKDLGAGGRLDGVPFHQGTRFLKEMAWVHRDGDSFVVQRLRGAGFVIAGKTNVPELGFSCTTEPRSYGPTRNPWDVRRSPAGSSGGAAAAVAAGLVPAAHGSDGGGSIRMPAAACGVVGLKVSHGRISIGPHAGEGNGHSEEGCLTRSVRDTAAILDVLAGAAPGDPVVAPPPARSYREEVGAPPGRLRVGVRTTSPLDGKPVDPDCVTATERAAATLEGLGHTVDVGHPPAMDDHAVGTAIITVHAVGRAAQLDGLERMIGRPLTADDIEARLWDQVQLGRSVSGPRYLDAREDVTRWIRAMASWWATGRDLLVTPTVGTPAPELGVLNWSENSSEESALASITFNPFAPAFNHTGQPAISLPLGESATGLPIGVQLVAAYGREDLLIRVAAQLEDAMPWHDRRPAVHA
jgi:amidase